MKVLVVHLGLDSLFYLPFFNMAHETWIVLQVSSSQVKGLVVDVEDIPHMNCPLLIVCLFLL